MFFQPFRAIVAALMAGTLCAASPTVMDARVLRPLNELVARDPMEIARDQYLEKRLSADFELERQWKNEVLFGGSWVNVGDNDSESVELQVSCIDCWTKGTVTAKLTTEDIFIPIVRLEFDAVEAHVNLGLKVSAGATYAINLFSSNTPLGLGLPGLSLGMVFHLDLVFSMSTTMDLSGGFYVKLAEGSYLETNVLTGEIVDELFDGIGTKGIPVEVKTGSGTLKAALRLRVQCGAEADIDLIGFGAGAVVGIYANLVEFVAVLDSTPTCALQAREWFNLNVGAYARLDVVVDFTRIGAVPTVSTTLVNSPTWTQCLIDDSPVVTDDKALPAGPASTAPAAVSPPASLEIPATPSPTETGASSFSTVIIQTLTGSEAIVPTIVPTVSPSSPAEIPVSNSSSPTDADLVTSTIFSTTIYTVTSCAAAVVNCPASWAQEIILTRTVDSYTTVCPEGAEVTFPAKASSAAPEAAETPEAQKGAEAVAHFITELVILKPCDSPIVHSFEPPTTRQPPAQHMVEYEEPLPTIQADSEAPRGDELVVGGKASPSLVLSQSHGGRNSSTAVAPARISSGSPVSLSQPTQVVVSGAGRTGVFSGRGVTVMFGSALGCLAVML